MTEIEVHPGKRLGKAPKKENARTFKLARLLDLTALPPIPTSFGYDAAVKAWPMYGNDQYGDCVFAEEGHHLQALTASAGQEIDVTEADVLKTYSAVTGFKPNDPNTDNGANILDALNYWRKSGIAGHKIGAFVDVGEVHHTMVKAAIFLFGGVSLGFDLPKVAQGMGQTWKKPAGRLTGDKAPGSWGGHCVYGVRFGRTGITVVTWGELTTVTWGFMDAYCTEAWGVLSHDFINGVTGKASNAFDLNQLQADLSQVGQPH